MAGVIGFGAYVPFNRLQRSAITAALGSGGGRGTRAVSSFDEDVTSMGVEAARIAVRDLGGTVRPERLLFATADPPYLDKTNANVIHAALALDPSAFAADFVGSVRSGVGALLAAVDSTVSTLVVLSDVRTGLPGGVDEAQGGDGAAALVFGDGTGAPILAEVLAQASATDEFLDRWRTPGEPASKVWEERFGEHAYGPLADAAFADALKRAGLAPTEVDHLIVAGLPARAMRRFVGSAGVRPEAVVDDRSGAIGNCGTAHAGLVLADLLDRAGSGQTIALVVLADGVTAVVLRTTDALVRHQSSKPVAAQIEGGDDGLDYAAFLSWRGLLRREPPRRPDPIAPAAPPTHRQEGYKYGFIGSRCDNCAAVHLPPVRVCVRCQAIDRMTPQPMADVPATVSTYTIDRLAFTPNPPLASVVVDFDGGGRFRCELTDVDPGTVAIGDRVEMTFRRLTTANGIHNYFWKARPLVGSTS